MAVTLGCPSTIVLGLALLQYKPPEGIYTPKECCFVRLRQSHNLFLPANTRKKLLGYRRRNTINPRLSALFGFVKDHGVHFSRFESIFEADRRAVSNFYSVVPV